MRVWRETLLINNSDHRHLLSLSKRQTPVHLIHYPALNVHYLNAASVGGRTTPLISVLTPTSVRAVLPSQKTISSKGFSPPVNFQPIIINLHCLPIPICHSVPLFSSGLRPVPRVIINFHSINTRI